MFKSVDSEIGIKGVDNVAFDNATENVVSSKESFVNIIIASSHGEFTNELQKVPLAVFQSTCISFKSNWFRLICT